MRWLAFLFCALALVVGQFGATWSDAARYDRHIDIMPSDWAATNVWLESAECAFSRGAWLSICDGDRLVPISEHAIADDPGHALLLGLWSSASNRRATLADVARLNTALNTIGLLALAGLLFALRAYTTSIVLLALGPVEYLGWMGTSPHWSYIGIVSMAAVLPIALLAREEGMLPGWRGRAWLAAGLASLAIAVLVREAIGIMAFVVGAGVIAALAVRRLRAGHSVLNLLVAALLIFVAMATPTWVVMARDASFAMEPAQRLQTHGLLAHALSGSWCRGEPARHSIRRRFRRGGRPKGRAGRRLLLARVFPHHVEALRGERDAGPDRGGSHLFREGLVDPGCPDDASRAAVRPRAGVRGRPSRPRDAVRRVATDRVCTGLHHRDRGARLRRLVRRPGRARACRATPMPSPRTLSSWCCLA